MSSGGTTEQDREFCYETEAAKIPKYNNGLTADSHSTPAAAPMF
jgi:hypothetical protein